MMLMRQGFAVRLSLFNWYVASALAALMYNAAKGVTEHEGWKAALSSPAPSAVAVSLVGVAMIAIALDGTVVMRARGDALDVIGLFRRTRFRRDSSRFVSEYHSDGGRNDRYTLELTDGSQSRSLAIYWLLGRLLTDHAIRRLSSKLLDD